MGILSKLLVNQKIKSAKIVILGASGAGKTTFIKYLETGKPVLDPPLSTLSGSESDTIRINENFEINAIDIGGSEFMQKIFWSTGMSKADALVYIIDGIVRPSDDDDQFELSLFAFEYMKELHSPDKTILILINKQDLNGLKPLTQKEAYDLYPIDALKNKNLAVKLCSAKHGKGVFDSIQWLFEHLN